MSSWLTGMCHKTVSPISRDNLRACGLVRFNCSSPGQSSAFPQTYLRIAPDSDQTSLYTWSRRNNTSARCAQFVQWRQPFRCPYRTQDLSPLSHSAWFSFLRLCMVVDDRSTVYCAVPAPHHALTDTFSLRRWRSLFKTAQFVHSALSSLMVERGGIRKRPSDYQPHIWTLTRDESSKRPLVECGVVHGNLVGRPPCYPFQTTHA